MTELILKHFDCEQGESGHDLLFAGKKKDLEQQLAMHNSAWQKVVSASTSMIVQN